jgi:hypothetical protein
MLALFVSGIYLYKNYVRNTDRIADLGPTPFPSLSPEVPAGWGTFSHPTAGYRISYPDDFIVDTTDLGRVMVYKGTGQPEVGPANYVSVAVYEYDPATTGAGTVPAPGTVDPYDKMYIDILRSMKTGETKPLSEEEGLKEFNIFTRQQDEVLGTTTYAVYTNDKPWEFPDGTKEYRFMTVRGGKTYVVGAYTGSAQPEEYVIEEGVMRTIVGSVRVGE